MTATRHLAFLLVGMCLTGVLAATSDPSPGSHVSAAATARLTSITARTGRQGTSLAIHMSEPAPYVATRADALTLVIELRSVDASGATTTVPQDPRSPVASVAIEPSTALGSSGSRVRIRLGQPVAHRVRSDRNTLVVDLDKPSAKNPPFVVAPVIRQTGAPDAMQALAQVDPMDALGASAAQPAQAATVAQAVVQAPVPPEPPQQAPAPAPVAPGAQTEPGAGRRFTGHPVSLDFQGADLRAVLRTFSEISGLNVVIDPAVTGSVDVALRDVPWDQALDIILRANKLGYIIDGTIVRIAPLSVLADEESQKRKLAEEQALAGELKVLTRTLSYAKADDLKELLTRSTLSQRGTVQVDTRTNTLIITDLADRLATAGSLIGTLDTPQPQVEIEARIVQTTKNYARALGIQWGFNGRVDPALGNTTNLAFPNSGSMTGRAVGAGVPAGTAVNLPAPGTPTSVLGLALGSINGALNLDMALSALENSGDARLLSTPRVTTQNNMKAEITQGLKVAYQTVANNTITTSFIDAALKLQVTPQITSSNTVIMQIYVDNGSLGPIVGTAGIPSINTQRAETTVMVIDGQTTVLGGIYSSTQRSTNDRTPGLGRIPLLNWMFKRSSVNDDNTELLIFITPRIVKG